MNKKTSFLGLTCMACCFIFGAMACGNYTPKREEFELFVRLEKTEAEIGESIPYTVEVVRKSGKTFAYKGSSTLCSVYFEEVSSDREPHFTYTDDFVENEIPSDFRWNKSESLNTSGLRVGTYLFAVQFSVKDLKYDFQTEINLK